MKKAKGWTDDEMILLLAFYFSNPRKSHVYNHQDCLKFANAIGRSGCAVDNQTSNIFNDLTEKTPKILCSRRLSQMLHQYKGNIPLLYERANKILEINSWNYPTFSGK